ncbi:hypothetical protein CG723_41465 [Streptomyces sp. CB01635]|nr:hypothetical protein CG723_41465 [Streptomyces sp. CB01635]
MVAFGVFDAQARREGLGGNSRSPIAAIITFMEARRQRAYVDLINHTADCPACNASPLCDVGRAIWNTWEGHDK